MILIFFEKLFVCNLQNKNAGFEVNSLFLVGAPLAATPDCTVLSLLIDSIGISLSYQLVPWDYTNSIER